MLFHSETFLHRETSKQIKDSYRFEKMTAGMCVLTTLKEREKLKQSLKSVNGLGKVEAVSCSTRVLPEKTMKL